MAFKVQNGTPVYDFDTPLDEKEFSTYLESAYKEYKDSPVVEDNPISQARKIAQKIDGTNMPNMQQKI